MHLSHGQVLQHRLCNLPRHSAAPVLQGQAVTTLRQGVKVFVPLTVSYKAVCQLLHGACLLQRVAGQHRCRVTASSATQADVPAELSKIVSGFQMVLFPAYCQHQYIHLPSQKLTSLCAGVPGA